MADVAVNGVRLSSEDIGDDEFEDAAEDQPISCTMDLETALEETRVALNLFLNNRFELAKAKMEPWWKQSIYHALGYATIIYIKAMMTCDMADIEYAVQVTKTASDLCERVKRRPNGVVAQVSKFVGSSNDKSVTDEQVHAELIYAETLLQRALLTFVQDENLVNFVKGALKIRACFQSYKDCQRYLIDSNSNTVMRRQHSSSSNGKLVPHFESGVRMGIGTFNLMISTLPSRVLKLLEFVGFSGDKEFGLKHLINGSAMVDSLRGPLCSLVLLAWHLIFNYIVGTGDSDLTLCQKLLQPLVRNYPNGALVLYMSGRFNEVQGRMQEAIELLNQSISAQTEWRQFHHLCYWELMFCHSFLRQWNRAAEYANKLYNENKWSRSSYSYMCSSFILATQPNLQAEAKENVRKLLTQVPKLKLRIAGKSIPLEKFCIAKSARYFNKNERLVLAHYELIYLFNGFNILSKDEELVKPVLADVETVLQQHSRLNDLDGDDYCLCLLLKAVCLKHLQSPFQAEQCLLEIINNYSKSLTDNAYVVPYATFEMCLLKFENTEISAAKTYLTKAREFKGYLMESRLHFRMHAANEKLALQTPC